QRRAHGSRAAGEESGRDGTRTRRDGEVHVLRPAHPRGGDRRSGRRHGTAWRRRSHRVPAGVSDERDRLRIADGARYDGDATTQRAARLHRARGARNAAASDVSGAHPQRQRGAGPRVSATVRDDAGTTAEAGWPLLIGQHDDASLTDHLLSPIWQTRPGWWWLFGLSCAGTLLFIGTISYTIARGIGVWGNNIPVAWAYAIINFVWWVGIGHAGTFISAFLLLLNQRWRGSVNRI